MPAMASKQKNEKTKKVNKSYIWVGNKYALKIHILRQLINHCSLNYKYLLSKHGASNKNKRQM